MLLANGSDPVKFGKVGLAKSNGSVLLTLTNITQGLSASETVEISTVSSVLSTADLH